MRLFSVIIAVICVFIAVPPAGAATYVPVEDAIFYDLLARLEAEGVITSGLLNRKPVSRTEARRLLRKAESGSADRGAYIKSLVWWLRERLGDPAEGTQIKIADSAYARSAYTNAGVHVLEYNESLQNQQPFNYNNNGDLYRRGLNVRTGFTSRIEDWGPFSVAVNPEFRYPEPPVSEDRLVTKKAYAILGLGAWDVAIGQDSQWWGPGHHGALIVSNNAEPFTMLKVTNPVPVRLPWIFEGLGPFGFTFFVTNLEKARDIPEPYLYGLRFDFKPSPYFEIGFEKTALLGGREGRPEDLNIWIDSLFGANDADNCVGTACYETEPGDQRAGFDFTITIPWRVQPVQIYMEAVGEDEMHNRPTHWAILAGLYFPRFLTAEQFDFRAEFATTRGRKFQPYIWYVHKFYDSYTYRGNIIGHHIGTDSNDLFIQTTYLMPSKNARLFLSYDREEHNLYAAGAHEVLHEASTGILRSMTERIDLKAGYRHGWLRNEGNVPKETRTVSAFGIEMHYRF